MTNEAAKAIISKLTKEEKVILLGLLSSLAQTPQPLQPQQVSAS